MSTISRVSLFLVSLMGTSALGQIVDVPVLSFDMAQSNVFTTTDRIVLRVSVKPSDRYQARFLRGSKQSLIAAIPQLTSAGCVEYKSVPFVVAAEMGLVDLQFPRLSPEWVRNDEGEFIDERYVVVLERIRKPDLNPNLRVKAEFARTYIDRGFEIVLKAPPQPKPSIFDRIAQSFGRLLPAISVTVSGATPIVVPMSRSSHVRTTTVPITAIPTRSRPTECLEFK